MKAIQTLPRKVRRGCHHGTESTMAHLLHKLKLTPCRGRGRVVQRTPRAGKEKSPVFQTTQSIVNSGQSMCGNHGSTAMHRQHTRARGGALTL